MKRNEMKAHPLMPNLSACLRSTKVFHLILAAFAGRYDGSYAARTGFAHEYRQQRNIRQIHHFQAVKI